MRNAIRELRARKSLSQRRLAELVGTSQQQIQRIEAGRQAARFDLAARICTALEAPMEKVFPETAAPLTEATRKRNPEQSWDWLVNEGQKAMEEGGVEVDPRYWYFHYTLRNGVSGQVPISGADARRVFKVIQSGPAEIGFIVFETDKDRVAINARHLIHSALLWDAPVDSNSDEMTEDDEKPSFRAWTTVSPVPIGFDAEPDTVALEDDPDADAELQTVFDILETCCYEDQVVSVMSEDGEWSFFRVDDLAMVSAALWTLGQNDLEEDEE